MVQRNVNGNKCSKIKMHDYIIETQCLSTYAIALQYVSVFKYFNQATFKLTGKHKQHRYVVWPLHLLSCPTYAYSQSYHVYILLLYCLNTDFCRMT